MEFNGTEDADARGRIAALEEKAKQHDRAILVLQDKLKQLSTDFGRLAGGNLNTAVCCSGKCGALSCEVSSLKTRIAAGLREWVAEQLSTKFNELRKDPSVPKTQIVGLPPHSTPSFDSQIISDFPEIFTEFQRKRFSLLLRDSRDGFKAQEFHGGCDNHANTLTVILDTNGNIVRGFTLVKWE
jgi:hypothetical protein